MCVRGLILHPDFVHRLNDNGTVDSICLRCFVTVASLPKELNLEEKENAHACCHLARQTGAMKFGPEILHQDASSVRSPALK
jgi:hypothetical protein